MVAARRPCDHRAYDPRRPPLHRRALNDFERSAVIDAALDAADAALQRARERNVPRRPPRALARLGVFGATLIAGYNRLFARQREIAADQNDALVALSGALRELVSLLRE